MRLSRERWTGIWSDLREAWSHRAVKRGFLGTLLLFLGSLTPAYLPQNSPWWEPMRALGLDNWWAKSAGTAMVVAAVVLLVQAWFSLRPSSYVQVKHWAICLIWSLPLLFAPPIFSHDAYAYAAEGWLLRNGLNPYEASISVLPGPFADQTAWLWRYNTAMYPPLSLQMFHGLVILAGNNPYFSAMAMRIPALIGVAIMVILLPRLARRMGADPQQTAWFATINPLIIIDFVGGAHNDALMAGLVVLALWLAFHDRFWWAAITVGIAAAIKQPAFLAFYPVALIGRPWTDLRWRSTLRALSRLALSLGVSVAVFVVITWATGLGYGWVSAADEPGKVVTLAPFTMVGTGLKVLLELLGFAAAGEVAMVTVRTAGLLLTAAVMVYLALGIGRTRPVTFLSWSYLAFAFGGLSMHSWYLTWGGMLLPLTRPNEKVISAAVTLTTVLLAYGAGNLAWRNDAIALGIAGLALVLTLLWRHTQSRAQLRAKERTT